ncbi:MAG: PRC-barrel domain [Solirubrobacteraceae bacterium]|jgi:sporulation protein YlmC with PRC-barrel domain|nr:PRC-barrel domain [Solirubrobacteraceae bacterium]
MILASDLIGCVVRTESGSKLGRVHDLRAHRDGDEWLLVGLVVGRGGMVARLGQGEGEGEGGSVRTGRVIDWPSIVGLDDGSITVRDDVDPGAA